MRTSVEITDQQRAALTLLAGRRGMRGFSPLVREAIDLYLAEQEGGRLDAALSLEGVITADDAEEVERRIRDAWSTWATAS